MFFLADAAQASLEGKFSVLGGGVEKIFAPTFPVIQPLSLLAKLAFDGSEIGEMQRVRVRFASADGSIPILDFVQSITPKQEDPNELARVHVVINMIPTLPRAGRYHVTLSLNDTDIEQLALDVRQQTEAPRK